MDNGNTEYSTWSDLYLTTFNQALELMNMAEGLEPTSALKECAFNNGIKEGDELGKFVLWAREKIEGCMYE
jgi:hypothetical protein|tara:strand:+ start:11626 stop:11838 length:213 start_codon:yes stop_codon:yes gene_type:complete